jgi:hypothetical protein
MNRIMGGHPILFTHKIDDLSKLLVNFKRYWLSIFLFSDMSGLLDVAKSISYCEMARDAGTNTNDAGVYEESVGIRIVQRRLTDRRHYFRE